MSSWRERLAFAPLETAERGEEIALRLRHSIELGVLEDGAQLPSESELAARMRVSTMTLRTALAELRHLGLVETRRGKGGGSFVRANTGDIAKAQRDTLAAYSLEDLRDIREYRAVLAGSAAAVAAGRSQQVPIGRLASMAAMIGTAKTPAEMMRADSQFHVELAATSGSVLFTRQEMAMQAEVGALVWAGASDRRRAAAKEHAMIVDAIRAADAARARLLAEEHVRRDMNRLIDLRLSLDSPPPGSLPADEGIDNAISAVESFASRLEGAAAASITSVEEAAQAGLDHAKKGRLDELEDVYDVARENLKAMPALYGTGFIAEKGYFGEPGSIWCYLPSGPESPQRFEMDPEFYDYSTAPWWPASDADDTVHASYAYIDALGTNQHVITFTKRVTKAGKMAGVAAVDVLVSRLQTEFDPLLRPLPPNTCIVDQNEVVIATNTASLVGVILSSHHQAERRIALPSVPWSLCLSVSAGENAAVSDLTALGDTP
ncbi:DNA-binding transcriptional regulator, FadR family [Arthrobacter cupressi]|uniref:DNA-binding transcriptional regulator, FadR family n=1 Tax=Arthrobacter cupressi TaxID=1045773 RepID=A0A1G8N4P0_9MICC|nr:DNA-binding FadR family transcriptional regulator [Arthrobacter cupressi]SDI75138.1 DNA-binding transcriptional regulator, FadR family [Arthrobacter cupressi]